MIIPFNLNKVAQAAAVLLKTEASRRMSRLRLLKLLYIADRQSLIERGRPITGDQPVAMDHGPVLSRTYDLIKGVDYASPDWERHLRSAGPRDVELLDDPGVGLLTRYEIAKLQAVAALMADKDDWAVAEATHLYVEWSKNAPPKGSCKRIPLDDLLEATGLTDRKEELLDLERAELAADRAFGD